MHIGGCLCSIGTESSRRCRTRMCCPRSAPPTSTGPARSRCSASSPCTPSTRSSAGAASNTTAFCTVSAGSPAASLFLSSVLCAPVCLAWQSPEGDASLALAAEPLEAVRCPGAFCKDGSSNSHKGTESNPRGSPLRLTIVRCAVLGLLALLFQKQCCDWASLSLRRSSSGKGTAVTLPKSGHAPVFCCLTGTYSSILVMFLRFVLPKPFG